MKNMEISRNEETNNTSYTHYLNKIKNRMNRREPNKYTGSIVDISVVRPTLLAQKHTNAYANGRAHIRARTHIHTDIRTGAHQSTSTKLSFVYNTHNIDKKRGEIV